MASEVGYYDDPERSRRWATWALGLSFVPVAGAAVASALAGLVLSGPRDEQDRGRRRAGAALGISVAGTVLLTSTLAVVAISEPEPDVVDASPLFRPGAPTVAASTTHGEILLEDLVAGDCLDEDLEVVGVQRHLTVSTCDVPHLAQVAHVEDLPSGGYPGDGAVEDMTESICTGAFESFVGRSFASSRLGLYYYFPTSESWVFDRSVTCVVTEDAPVTGTLQGSGR